MFTLVKDVCYEYYDHLPKNTIQTVGKSALYSFTACVIFVTLQERTQTGQLSNLLQPLVVGSIGALASSVHALMTPLFDLVFGDRKVKSYREGIKWVVVSVLTSILLSGLRAPKIDLQVTQFIIPLSINFFRGTMGLVPEIIGFFDPKEGDELTKQMQNFGFLPKEGANSIYFIANSPY